MELEGLNVVKYLNGHDTVRDGSLVSLSIRPVSSDPIIELLFEVPHNAGVRIVKLELRDIQEFNYGFATRYSHDVIEFLKCIMTDAGDFYLSLDPYDERAANVSESDNDFFRSKFVKLTTLDPM
ncbi:MAG TPA: hypothetical protein VMJ73_06535 [Rhizomicrobium sp.]|nr:hypothetical protein [Rhizomicrobium sp.]